MPQKTILAPERSTSTIVDPIASRVPQSGASDLDTTHRCLTCRGRKDWNGTLIGGWTTEEERHSDPSDLAPVGERPVIDQFLKRRGWCVEILDILVIPELTISEFRNKSVRVLTRRGTLDCTAARQ
jgi:hypothetical protein